MSAKVTADIHVGTARMVVWTSVSGAALKILDAYGYTLASVYFDSVADLHARALEIVKATETVNVVASPEARSEPGVSPVVDSAQDGTSSGEAETGRGSGSASEGVLPAAGETTAVTCNHGDAQDGEKKCVPCRDCGVDICGRCGVPVGYGFEAICSDCEGRRLEYERLRGHQILGSQGMAIVNVPQEPPVGAHAPGSVVIYDAVHSCRPSILGGTWCVLCGAALQGSL